MNLILHPVGDGLFMEVFSRDQRYRLITDYGSQQAVLDSTLHRFNPIIRVTTDFLLSHFHLDHYKGLFLLGKHHVRTHFRKVYSARLPELPEARYVLYAMRALDAFSLGGWSGSIDHDFLQVIRRLNIGDFTWRTLTQGNTFNVGDRSFTVTWPPRVLPEKTRKSIVKTIKNFEEEIKAFPQIKDFYEQLRENGEWRIRNMDDASDDEITITSGSREDLVRELPDLDNNVERAQILQPINRQLKDAANFFSLAYFDNRLNFFGDLYPTEINKCVEFIESATTQRKWQQVILPHHGTQWHKALLKLSGVFGCSSIGPELLSHWRTENAKMCLNILKTYPPDHRIVLGDGGIWAMI